MAKKNTTKKQLPENESRRGNFDPLAKPDITILTDHPILRQDEPDPDQRETDGFDLYSRVGAAYDIIRHKNTRTPLAISVNGDWGTGKSSTMRWLWDNLEQWKEEGDHGDHLTTRCVWFDPWKYHSKEEVWRGIIAEVIINSIDLKNASLENVVSAAKKFGGFLGRSFLTALSSAKLKAGSSALGGEVAVDLKALKEIVEDFQQTNHPEKAYLNEFENTLKEWIKETISDKKERMVLFIDDLDRCLPEVTLEVLEALKLYLNIPDLIFVVGLDDSVVMPVVMKHYKDHGVDKEKARHYLQKIFQVEIQISPTEQQIHGYLETQIEAIDELTDSYWSNHLNRWNKDYGQIIIKMIEQLASHNPREIKRLINNTLMRAIAAVRNPSLEGSDAQRFTQGAQVYLIQHVIRYFVEGTSLLLRDDVQEFFEKWSTFARDYSGFWDKNKHTIKNYPDWLSEKNAEGIRAEAEEAFTRLSEAQPRYKTKESEQLGLFGEENLWILLAIPFSQEIAAATATVRTDSSTPEEDETSHGGSVTSDIPVPSTLPAVLQNAIAKELNKPTAKLDSADIAKVSKLDLSWNFSVGDATLQAISGMTQLQSLNLTIAKVTDAGLKHLIPLTQLQELHLEGINVTDVGLNHLGALTQLRVLILDGPNITDEGLKHLETLTQLQELHFWNSTITDMGLEHLKDLTLLQDLVLCDSKVTDAGLEHLKGLMQLQKLYLSDTQVTDTGLDSLRGLTQLQELHLRGTQVSDAGVGKLKKSLSDVEIWR